MAKSKKGQKDAYPNPKMHAIHTLSDVEPDSEEEFHQQRDKIAFDDNTNPPSESEMEEEVFALNESEESEDSVDDEEIERWEKLAKQLNPKLGDSDQDSNDSDDSTDDEKAWGKSKKIYYNDDKDQTEEYLKLEEQEAISMQRKKANQMNDEDFFEDSFSQMIAKGQNQSLNLEESDTEFIETSVFDLDSISNSKLPESEKTSILGTVMPEIPELVQEFIEKCQEFDEIVKGVGVSQLKKHVLACYLMNLSFYFSLRIQDRMEKLHSNVRNHPVVSTLVQLRDILDTIDDQLSEEEDSENLSENDSHDELMNDDDETVFGQDESMDSDFSQDDESLSNEETNTFIHDESDSLTESKINLSIPSIKVSKSKKRKSKIQDCDFGEEIVLNDADKNDKLNGKKSLSFHLSRVEESISKKNKQMKFAGDSDIPIKNRQVNSKEDEDEYGELDEIETKPISRNNVPTNDYYESIKASKIQEKQNKKQKRQECLQLETEAKLGFTDLNKIEDGEKRGATWQILKNKGLTPHRKKIDRNPRVKKRVKYETAVKRLKDFRRVAVDKHTIAEYGGETSGIKTNLARSVKL